MIFKTHQVSFEKFIILSFLAHLSLALIFTIKKSYFPSEDILIQTAVRVDMVGLPEKVFQKRVTQERSKVTKKNKPIRKKLERVALRKKKTINQFEEQAFKKLKNISENKRNSTTLYAGNKVVRGASLKGIDRIDYDNFFSNLHTHIKAKWELPSWLVEEGLSALVLIKMDKKGNLISKQFLRKSGNETFDRAVFSCLKNSIPFPEPPQRLKKYIGSLGIELEFP